LFALAESYTVVLHYFTLHSYFKQVICSPFAKRLAAVPLQQPIQNEQFFEMKTGGETFFFSPIHTFFSLQITLHTLFFLT
jgi:hypothetical protein